MKHFFKLNQKGTAMTEVACVAALIAVAGIVSLGFMGGSVSNTFTGSGNLLNSRNGASGLTGAEIPASGQFVGNNTSNGGAKASIPGGVGTQLGTSNSGTRPGSEAISAGTRGQNPDFN